MRCFCLDGVNSDLTCKTLPDAGLEIVFRLYVTGVLRQVQLLHLSQAQSYKMLLRGIRVNLHPDHGEAHGVPRVLDEVMRVMEEDLIDQAVVKNEKELVFFVVRSNLIGDVDGVGPALPRGREVFHPNIVGEKGFLPLVAQEDFLEDLSLVIGPLPDTTFHSLSSGQTSTHVLQNIVGIWGLRLPALHVPRVPCRDGDGGSFYPTCLPLGGDHHHLHVLVTTD